MTTTLDKIALCVLRNEALEVRALVQAWLRLAPDLAYEPRPSSLDPYVLAIAAGIVEMIAARTNQPAPAWATSIGPVDTPYYLVRAALQSPKMRERIERESPEPLRKRNVFAPPGYLEMV